MAQDLKSLRWPAAYHTCLMPRRLHILECEYCKSKGYTHQGWCLACWKWWREEEAKLKAADAKRIVLEAYSGDAKACVAACKAAAAAARAAATPKACVAVAACKAAAAAAARPAGTLLMASMLPAPAAERKAAPASAGSAQVASEKPDSSETAATPKAAASKKTVTFHVDKKFDPQDPRNWHPTYVDALHPTHGWHRDWHSEVQKWQAFRAKGIAQITDATGPPWWKVTGLNDLQ